VVRVGLHFILGLRVLLASSVVVCLNAGCDLSGDQCESREQRCTANGVDNCQDDTNGNYWRRDACLNGTVCVEGPYVCAFGTVRDPRCLAPPGVCTDPACYGTEACDGKWILRCTTGYLTDRFQCSSLCVVPDGGTKVICAESADPDPVCNVKTDSYYELCNGDTLVRCNGVYRFDQRDCRTACDTCTAPPHVGTCVATTMTNASCEPL
jgi:hypothetical protein